MAAMAGLLNQSMTAGRALAGAGANPLAASPAAIGATGSAASAGSSSATISANDFLTLLVTEMQNQDPTAQTDPNEYISQLVQVNSLEQLISINQNLSTALGTPTSGSGAAGQAAQSATAGTPLPGTASRTAASLGDQAVPAASMHKAAAQPVTAAAGSNPATAIGQFAQSVGSGRAPGNLSVPQAQAAAHKVAHALDGKSHKAKLHDKPVGM